MRQSGQVNRLDAEITRICKSSVWSREAKGGMGIHTIRAVKMGMVYLNITAEKDVISGLRSVVVQ